MRIIISFIPGAVSRSCSVCWVVPVLFLKSFKCSHVVDLSKKLTEDSNLDKQKQMLKQ